MGKEFIEGSGGIMDGGGGESGSISSTAHVKETENGFKSKLTNWTTATAKKVTFMHFLKSKLE